MNFDRFNRYEKKSWAYWQFNEYETQINSMYWSGAAALGCAIHQVQVAPAPVNVHSVLFVMGPDAKRVVKEQSDYVNHANDFSKWSRCSFIVAATGSLETYIKRVVLTALISDPALLYGKSKAIDGTSWLKIGIKVDHSKIVKDVTSGTWSQRYAALRKLFGAIPKIQGHINNLDKIRKFRNNVGHAFGRDLTTDPDLATRQPGSMGSINELKFKLWLSIISETAIALDTHLVSNHIGDFEPVMHLHNHLKSLGGNPVLDKNFAHSYKTILAREEGHSKGLAYCEGLIDYYKKI